MKRILLSAFAVLAFAASYAQTSNVVLFTENGERFTAVLNGLRMNEEPVTNLKVTDLNQPGYKLKVIFENADLGEMDKNLYLQTMGNEVVYMIKKNKKGEYKLAYRSETPIAQAPPAPAAQQVIIWGAPAPVVVEETVTTTTTTGGGMDMNTNVNTNTTTNSESVNMSVGINGFGMDVNVTATDEMTTTGNMGVTQDVNMTTTTTTTTTTTGGDWGQEEVIVVEEAPCYGMAPADFSDACNSIRSKSFEDSKLTLAKQIIRGQCISSEQVRDMSKLFDFEDTKLEFAKFAYGFVADPQNFYKVNDAFTFESSIEELDAYINAQR